MILMTSEDYIVQGSIRPKERLKETKSWNTLIIVILSNLHFNNKTILNTTQSQTIFKKLSITTTESLFKIQKHYIYQVGGLWCLTITSFRAATALPPAATSFFFMSNAESPKRKQFSQSLPLSEN